MGEGRNKFFVFSRIGRQLKTRISVPINETSKILNINFMRINFLILSINNGKT